MNEARRFLRYVIPGLVFVVQLIVLLWLLRPDWVQTLYNQELKEESGIAVVSAAFLATGGLGFLFSAIHHSLHRRKGCGLMDHRKVLKQLESENAWKPWKKDSNRGNATELTRDEAWSALAALWHQRAKTSPKIDGASARTDALMDVMHSMGTNRIATLVAAVVGFGLVLEDCTFDFTSLKGYSNDSTSIIHALIASGVGVGMFCVFQSSYVCVARLAQDVIDQVLNDALQEEKRKSTSDSK